jgi:hypothetical protein
MQDLEAHSLGVQEPQATSDVYHYGPSLLTNNKRFFSIYPRRVWSLTYTRNSGKTVYSAYVLQLLLNYERVRVLRAALERP